MNTAPVLVRPASANIVLRTRRIAPPVMTGVIERRILVNFRVDPDILGRMLPAPFIPRQAGTSGVAGICLLRLRELRPARFPTAFGLRSENVAHRIAIAWSENGLTREGVFIPRRDSDSWINRCAGGRLFPGRHHAANFRCEEQADRFIVDACSRDGGMRVYIRARLAEAPPPASVFRSLAEATAFFAGGSIGWSPTAETGVFEGLELVAPDWRLEALAVDELHSSYFNDVASFPPGTVQFDSAWLMRNMGHEWRGCGLMRAMS